MKIIVIYIIIIAIAVTAVYRIGKFAVLKFSKEKQEETERRVPVRASAAVKTDIEIFIDFTGDVVGTEVVNVFSHVPGKVEVILIKEGQHVSRGSTIFKINRDIVGMDFMPAIVDSPISGHVASIYAQRGMTVAQTTPLAQIVNMANVEVKIRVTEENLNRVQNGMPAVIKVDAFPDKTFQGRIYKMSAIVDPVSRTREVHILIDNRNRMLKHGMFASVKLITSKINDALVVPVDSVFSASGEETYVMTAADNRAVKKIVRAGETVSGITRILSGLSEGDIVITLGKENIVEGDALLIYRDDADENNDTVDPEPQKTESLQ